MKKLSLILVLFFVSPLAYADFWTEGAKSPQSRVNTNLKSLSPKAYLNVSEAVSQSVVNINTTQVVKGYQTPFGFQVQPNQRKRGREYQNPFEQFFGPFFGGPSQSPSTKKTTSLGSGFLLSKDGFIATNNHVIAKADEIRVTFFDETEVPAKVIGRDPKTDVALIKVDRVPPKVKPVILGNSNDMKVGEIVVAIGNPFGLSHSVTQGIISAKERRTVGIGPYDSFIQTDASINPGNSGGPLLNIYGEVIGINTAIHATGQGIGFAIPINLAKDVLRKLKETGRVTRGQLGVMIQKIDADHVKALKLKTKEGALVSQVMEESPAAEAGIKPGDVIVTFDNKKIKDWNQLPITVANTPVGKRVRVGLIRNGAKKTVFAKVGKLEDETVAPTEKKEDRKDPLGIKPQNLTPELSRNLGLDAKQKGVLVSEIATDSVAYEKGVRRGDVLIEVNQKKITNVQSYIDATKKLKKGSSVLLLLARRQGTIFVAFQL